MKSLPPFDDDGLLPPGDYEMTFREIYASIPVKGPNASKSWARRWRRKLVRNLETLVAQLMSVGITEIFADGSFVEEKDVPNDIDGYFVCDPDRWESGELQRRLLKLNRRTLMIRTELEYRETLSRVEKAEEAFHAEEARLKAKGLDRAAIKRAMQPGRAFHAQVKYEVEMYQRLKRGRFNDLHNLQGIGQLLIGARIASGLSQRELAERLGVHETQVSRDERNEYNGITVERADRILDVLGVKTITRARKVKDLAKSA